MRRTWTPQQLKTLIRCYTTESKDNILSQFKTKTWIAISKKAKKLGLKRTKDSDWSEDEILTLKSNYKDTTNKEMLRLIPNRKLQAILMQASNLGLKKSKNAHGRHWHDDELKKLTENFQNHTYKELSEMIGRSATAIKLKMSELCMVRKTKLGFKVVDTGRSLKQKAIKSDCYKLLEDTSEAYYWTGFIMADGFLNHDDKRLVFRLASKDKIQVEGLARFLSYDGDISRHITEYVCKDGNFATNDGFTLNMGDTFEKFCKKFDIRHCKSYFPPRKLMIENKDLFLSFLIGFIDGDGNIHRIKDRKDCGIRIKVHKTWLDILKQFDKRLYEVLDIEPFNKANRVRLNRDGYAEINWADTRILRALKLKSNELPILDRKWKLIDETKISRYEIAAIRRDKVLDLYRNGSSIKEISNKLKLGFSGVYRTCRVYGTHLK